MFYIVEEFFSIQGEGKYAGEPSYFLRTGGCNLNCPGFKTKYSVNGKLKEGCDTYFAVDRAFAKNWQLIDNANSFIEHLKNQFKKIGYTPAIVITGGEPFLYYKDEVFYSLIEYFVTNKIKVTFETNATIDIDFKNYPIYKDVIYALSVKLSNSKEPKEKRLNKNFLKNVANYAKDYYLKFTLDKNIIKNSAYEEILEIKNIFDDVEIFCMPVGECRETIWGNDEAVFNFCKKYNFRYSDRLHIRVFDKTQGV